MAAVNASVPRKPRRKRKRGPKKKYVKPWSEANKAKAKQARYHRYYYQPVDDDDGNSSMYFSSGLGEKVNSAILETEGYPETGTHRRSRRIAALGLRREKLKPSWENTCRKPRGSSKKSEESRDECLHHEGGSQLRNWKTVGNTIFEVVKTEGTEVEREDDETAVMSNGGSKSKHSLFQPLPEIVENDHNMERANDSKADVNIHAASSASKRGYKFKSDNYVFESSSDEETNARSTDGNFEIPEDHKSDSSSDSAEEEDHSESESHADSVVEEETRQSSGKRKMMNSKEEDEALDKLLKYKGLIDVSMDHSGVFTYRCKVCHFYHCKTASEFLSHMILHDEGKLQCDQCEFNGSSAEKLEQHKEEHKLGKLQCDLCGYTSNKRNLFERHMSRVHTAAEDKKFICSSEGCRSRFVDRILLTNHQKFHREKRYLCHCCGKLYYIHAQLKDHIAAEHEKTGCARSLVCKICGKKYLRKSLKMHKRRHLNHRPLKCQYCDKRFNDRQQQKNHERTHTGEKPFQCQFCDFRAAKSSQVESHTRTHTGRKPYKCTECHYAATWNVQLKSHMNAHSSATAVTCDLCNVVFINETSLKRHNKKAAVLHEQLMKSATSVS